MVNSWSLLYDELYGDDGMKKSEHYDDFENPLPAQDSVTVFGAGDYSPVSTSSSVTEATSQKDWEDFWKDDGHSLVGNPYYGADGGFSFSSNTSAGPDTITFSSQSAVAAADTVSMSSIFGSDDYLFTGTRVKGGMGNDHISFSYDPSIGNTAYNDNKYFAEGYDPYPTLGNVDTISFDTKPQPNLKGPSNQKYQEDKGITDLKDYVASTYNGHYTNQSSDTQTLDLIHSVGDAESFCRSNAIKYLSRYDKKGQAKRDILKAMHYCLLLYYFSGNTNNETPTRGYETF